MKLICLICTVLIAFLGCAGGLSKEQIAAQEEAKRAEYNRNSTQASEILQGCKKSFTGKDAGTVMKLEKQLLDVACQTYLAQMEINSQVWDDAITRSVYMEDTDASIELAKHKLEVSERGMDLIGVATHECLTTGMRQIKSSDSRNSEGFNELLEYYTVYNQIYDLAVEPKGSLVSYRQSINDLRLETTKLSSRLNIVLQ